MQDQTAPELDALTKELRKLNTHRFITIQNSMWRMVGYQFLRGLAFGLGTLMGASVLVSILAWWASQFSFIPVIGEWMNLLVLEMNAARGQ
ncbi:MAG: DUF5665 domain-containing protein [Pseudomonadota bacterium]